MQKKINAAIIGGSGYTGLELLKILANHKYCNLICTVSKTFQHKIICEEFKSVFPSNRVKDLKFCPSIEKDLLKKIDVIFLCLPPSQSMKYLSEIIKDYKGAVIDIGSDFRLNDSTDYMYWYKKEHILNELLPAFQYSIPETNKETLFGKEYIANPGCYPTSILLGLSPLMEIKDLYIQSIIIDAKSGVSGAGRKIADDYTFLNINESFYPYATLMHRHIGEIEQEIKKISNRDIKISFTPHIIPVNRGIYSDIYCLYKEDEEPEKIFDMINSKYMDYYKGSIFVKYIGNAIPRLRDVIGTNMAIIGVNVDARCKLIKIFVAIDNLLKGASGQAVQNMNLMFGIVEDEGLRLSGIFS
jgi:N-acetyl-gamma-glutamyl-phosphate reductase